MCLQKPSEYVFQTAFSLLLKPKGTFMLENFEKRLLADFLGEHWQMFVDFCEMNGNAGYADAIADKLENQS
ncbi:hypothetical protein BG910_06440 [Neisseria chenwenguii]|uniref:Uncharacterized protein n=1 Tax=Neisseria chenwenguii TaxID=1853278 RepID=A0A220S146_9NEIS|nr:hypothetical protein BG910_04715 [Neisseria chenwenguii]ASK27425.1 hypothetical protein BG910_06440 [Neisseria chenwenguii]ROV56608.1 hypothetical protein EGS38_04340 [Neisseria chenwenguii]